MKVSIHMLMRKDCLLVIWIFTEKPVLIGEVVPKLISLDLAIMTRFPTISHWQISNGIPLVNCANFVIIPSTSSVLIEGHTSYSNYEISHRWRSGYTSLLPLRSMTLIWDLISPIFLGLMN